MKHVVHWELVTWSCQLSLDTNSAGVLQNWERVLKIIIKLMWVIWLFRSRSFLATIADFATRDNIRYFITFQKNKILRTLFIQDHLSFLVATCKKNPIIMLLIFQKLRVVLIIRCSDFNVRPMAPWQNTWFSRRGPRFTRFPKTLLPNMQHLLNY